MLATRLLESGTILRLGSLRQLILVSFLVALIPLIALLWQSQHDLAKVGKMTAEETHFIASVVRQMQQLDGVGVELERALRQFRVLGHQRVEQLSENALERFTNYSESLCARLPDDSACINLQQTHESLTAFRDFQSNEELNGYLTTLSQQLAELRISVDDAVKLRLAQQQDSLSSMQVKQAWLTALLVSISLLLILLGSQLIINPVRKLKLVIKMLARQQGRLPPISTKAPKELVGVERDLHWLGGRLAQLEHIRTALLRHAAHELKTPLASIKEGCSLLSDGTVGELNKGQSEVLSLLSTSTLRLNTLIEKLLDYNLLLQQAQPTFQQVNVEQMVKACLNDYQLALQKNQLNVTLDIKEIRADNELLRRILDNLVSNAVAHGDMGKPISIHVWLEDDFANVDVANCGNKIPDDKVEDLFEPFIRGENARNDNVIGTGLGLSIVADCARIMHGDVQVVDIPNADVCFRVRIPQQEDNE